MGVVCQQQRCQQLTVEEHDRATLTSGRNGIESQHDLIRSLLGERNTHYCAIGAGDAIGQSVGIGCRPPFAEKHHVAKTGLDADVGSRGNRLAHDKPGQGHVHRRERRNQCGGANPSNK